ncbi:MAG: DUF2169 domain-containing protein [Polyangiaceae bacterium]|nr:DUF2169 domain-containing protein [Polyangiaceae bacterium]
MVAVRLVPSSSTRCGALAWRSQGKPFATIVAKVTLTYGPDGACRLDEPRAIVSRDQHLERNPTKSLEEATDLIPYLGKAELHLRGAAVCPSGSQVVPRVTITRDGGAILERAFVARPPAGARSVELVAENALGGPGHPVNPVGTPTPSLLNANDPSQPLLVGPIPRMWSARATLLTPEQRKATQQREVALDAAFDWEFFQAAAREQRAATFFRGDESLALAHLDAEQPQLEVRLPGARVEAAWVKGPRRAGAPGHALRHAPPRQQGAHDHPLLARLLRGDRRGLQDGDRGHVVDARKAGRVAGDQRRARALRAPLRAVGPCDPVARRDRRAAPRRLERAHDALRDACRGDPELEADELGADPWRPLLGRRAWVASDDRARLDGRCACRRPT